MRATSTRHVPRPGGRRRGGRGPAVLALLAALLVPAVLPAGAAGKSPAGTAGGGAGVHRVNVNTAGVEELQALPRIGPALARRIVEFRRKAGPFRRVEDLLAVRGIGPKLLERLRGRVSVGPAGAAAPAPGKGR